MYLICRILLTKESFTENHVFFFFFYFFWPDIKISQLADYFQPSLKRKHYEIKINKSIEIEK